MSVHSCHGSFAGKKETQIMIITLNYHSLWHCLSSFKNTYEFQVKITLTFLPSEKANILSLMWFSDMWYLLLFILWWYLHFKVQPRLSTRVVYWPNSWCWHYKSIFVMIWCYITFIMNCSYVTFLWFYNLFSSLTDLVSLCTLFLWSLHEFYIMYCLQKRKPIYMCIHFISFCKYLTSFLPVKVLAA